MRNTSTTLGSQRLLQIAVNQRPELLRSALRKSGALERRESVAWTSPLAAEAFREYRDTAALGRLGVLEKLRVPLSEFWPARGAVWDGLGVTTTGAALLVEAKAHIPEAASPASKASPRSLAHIQRSLAEARKAYAPRSSADWSGSFYQYANRLAFQRFLRTTNALPSKLVFLNFTNAADMDGPSSEAEWHGAIRLLHAVLGLPPDLTTHGVYHAFVDARHLTDAVMA